MTHLRSPRRTGWVRPEAIARLPGRMTLMKTSLIFVRHGDSHHKHDGVGMPPARPTLHRFGVEPL